MRGYISTKEYSGAVIKLSVVAASQNLDLVSIVTTYQLFYLSMHAMD